MIGAEIILPSIIVWAYHNPWAGNRVLHQAVFEGTSLGERFLGAPAMTAIPEDRRKVKMVFQETLQETNGMERDSGLAASDLAMVASVDFAAMENHLFFIGKTW